MGAPIVRRDELDAELGKLRGELRKKANAGKKAAADPDQAFVTRAQLRAEFIGFAQMLGIAPEVFETPAVAEPLEDLGETPEAPATDAAPAELVDDPEGRELVEAIHERKAAASDALFEEES